MILTLEEIRQAIEEKRLTAISIDTSIFDGQHRGLEWGVLKRVEQFHGSSVTVLLSDVVKGELEAHLRKDASESLSGLDKALKLASTPWRVSAERRSELKAAVSGAESPATIASRRIDDYVLATGAVVIKAEDHATIGEVLARYFEHRPPFADKETKKHEFPDALALLSLESWAAQEDTLVLVVSNDDDWIAYCTGSERLVALDDLATVLGCFQEEAANYCCRQIAAQARRDDSLGLLTSIETAINEQEWKIDFDVEADSQFRFDAEGTESVFTVSGLEGLDEDSAIEPVEYEPGQLVARLRVAVSADVTVHFSFEKWDGIDKEYMPMGTGSATVKEEMTVEVLVTFSGEFPNRHEVVNVEVLPQSYLLSVGEVEPDWMNDGDNFDD